jgi:Asp-tRNA(Asn)/Glu-tRNA(Gln) amidotransferase B subunit
MKTKLTTMNKIKTIDEKLLKARLSKDNVAKNLLVTLKGEFENAVKNGESADDSLVEKLAKKMIKNAELVGTDEAKQEILILKEFLPVQLTEAEIKSVILKLVESNSDKVEAFKSGNKGVIGMFIGLVNKETSGSADAKLVGKLVQEILQSV